MRTDSSTSFLLDAVTGWRTAHGDGVVADSRIGLHLGSDPNGPLSLSSADGSLGGLVLPVGMAFDATGILHLLRPEESSRVCRFDPIGRRFVAMDEEWRASGHNPVLASDATLELPKAGAVVDTGPPIDPSVFSLPASLAIVGHHLYLADGDKRSLQVFFVAPRRRAPDCLILAHLWGLDPRLSATSGPAVEAWQPVDVASHEGAAYILDRSSGRVYRHRPGNDKPIVVLDVPEAKNRWSRLALDRDGRLYLLDPSVPRLEIYELNEAGCEPIGCGSAEDRPLGHNPLRLRRAGQVLDPGEVRSRFPAPSIRLDHNERFCLPESLARLCDRQPASPPVDEPLALCSPDSGGLLFDRQGEPVAEPDPAEPGGKPLYSTSGTWFSEALDSEIHRCQWHRIELELGDLPPGSQVVVSTYSAQENLAAEKTEDLPEHLWETRFRLTGPMQPPEALSADRASHEELLVQSGEGQYLWLRLQLSSDGFATPKVGSLRVHYPRQSYMAYLPAVYSSEEESRSFLERFLSIAQTEWDQLDRRIEDIAGLFDPRAVPEGELLEYLASWLGLPLEGVWTGAQKRRMLAAAPKIYSHRGTCRGISEVLAIYLSNLTGVEPEAQLGYPVLIEGHRERQHLQLARRAGELAPGRRLWGRELVGRLQLGVYSREGEARLVSTGDPERDLFHEYAHRFRVFVPAAWVRHGEDEQRLRRALDLEKPAHASYEMCLVEPRFRVGRQSTLGLDSVVGVIPRARLYCPHHETDPAPSRAPRSRLGVDTVLAGRPHLFPSPPALTAPRGVLGQDAVLGSKMLLAAAVAKAATGTVKTETVTTETVTTQTLSSSPN